MSDQKNPPIEAERVAEAIRDDQENARKKGAVGRSPDATPSHANFEHG